jgi:gamma-butyrobetaine dioxygenase
MGNIEILRMERLLFASQIALRTTITNCTERSMFCVQRRGLASKQTPALSRTNQPLTNSPRVLAARSFSTSPTKSQEANKYDSLAPWLRQKLQSHEVKKNPIEFFDEGHGVEDELDWDISRPWPFRQVAAPVKVGSDGLSWLPLFLRDSCPCPLCVDPSSKQKNFQTTDIPTRIDVASSRVLKNGDTQIRWRNDLPGFVNHVSVFPESFFKLHSSQSEFNMDRSLNMLPRLWDRKRITNEFEYIDYEDYMTEDKHLHRALLNLVKNGLLLLRNVPESEKSVENIALRIGNIRDTFYGRTWDVKSVPQAKNVAYTQKYLGLHMDLLYMANPPGIQFLHCIKNTCAGGSSLFSDSFQAAASLDPTDFTTLSRNEVQYQYRNAGEHYFFSHPVIEHTGHIRGQTGQNTLPEQVDCDELGPEDSKLGLEAQWRARNLQRILHVNYSPPFQANFMPWIDSGNELDFVAFTRLKRALYRFAQRVEHPTSLYEYRLQEGECVIFNNRRVLHGRRQFDAGAGERWLKGAYVDTDVFMSRWRVLDEKFRHLQAQLGDLDSSLHAHLGDFDSRYADPNAEGNVVDQHHREAWLKHSASKAAE